jgi:hypothetical protein
MKLETTIILTKASCVVIEGFALGITAGLAQWATGGERPTDIAWIVIIASAFLNAASKLGSFLSSSFSNYLQKQNGNKPDAGLTKPETRL